MYLHLLHVRNLTPYNGSWLTSAPQQRLQQQGLHRDLGGLGEPRQLPAVDQGRVHRQAIPGLVVFGEVLEHGESSQDGVSRERSRVFSAVKASSLTHARMPQERRIE
jgi:hypothetical protein